MLFHHNGRFDRNLVCLSFELSATAIAEDKPAINEVELIIRWRCQVNSSV
jgi:hypothetical protein